MPAVKRNLSEHDRLARLNANAGEQKSSVERSQYLFDQIVLAHGNPAADQQQIALEAFAQQQRQFVGAIGRDRKNDGLTASGINLGGQRVAVGIANFVGAGRQVDVDQFVAGGQNGNARPAISRDLGASDGGGDSDDGMVHASPTRDHGGALSCFGAGGNNVLAGSHRAMHGHGGVFALGIFDHHDGIGARWNGRARHDFGRLPGCNLGRALFYSGSGLDLGDTTQSSRRGRDVGSPHCKSVTGGAGERREIAVGAQIFCQHKTEGVKQREHLRLGRAQRGDILLHHLPRLGE